MSERKPDKLEPRARELAFFAGIDPDSRIERPCGACNPEN